jgi:Zinc-finger of the MIZ type in Nse subunit
LPRDPMLDEARLFLCPLTKTFFNEPIKCACCHHVEQEAMLRRAGFDRYVEVKCPHPQCSAMWVLATSRLDFDFQKRLFVWKKKNSASLKSLQLQLNRPTNRSEYVAAARKVLSNITDAREIKYVEDWIAWAVARNKTPGHKWEQEVMPILPRHRKESASASKELVVIEPEMERESDYLCPVSQLVISVPMTNGVCKHRVDRDSLRHMCKNDYEAVIKCPVVGCVSHWKLRTAQVDSSFQIKIQAFLKRKDAQVVDISDSPSARKKRVVIDLC